MTLPKASTISACREYLFREPGGTILSLEIGHSSVWDNIAWCWTLRQSRRESEHRIKQHRGCPLKPNRQNNDKTHASRDQMCSSVLFIVQQWIWRNHSSENVRRKCPTRLQQCGKCPPPYPRTIKNSRTRLHAIVIYYINYQEIVYATIHKIQIFL